MLLPELPFLVAPFARNMERQNLASCFACPKSLNKCDDDVLSYALLRRNLEGGGDVHGGGQEGGPLTPMNSGIGRFRFYDLCISTTSGLQFYNYCRDARYSRYWFPVHSKTCETQPHFFKVR